MAVSVICPRINSDEIRQRLWSPTAVGETPYPTGAPHGGEFQNAPGERFERGACPAREGRPFEGIDELKPQAACGLTVHGMYHAGREITRKLVYNSEMCRGSLALRWGSAG